jgi:hypothetical protein
MVMGEPMLLVAALLLAWIVAALAAVALCVAARRGDRELALARPVVLHSVDGVASRHTRAG